MATTFTIGQYENLCNAIALGALETEYDGKKVKYRSLDQMLSTRRLMEKELGISKSGSGAHYPTYRDGVQ